MITRCPSSFRPSLTFHIFVFYAETIRNSTKLDRKQDLNVLYQVCIFRADWKTRWPPWPLIGWDIIDFLSVQTEFHETWQEASIKISISTVFVFSADRKKKTRWPPWLLISWDIFAFSSETTEWIQRTLTGSNISIHSTKVLSDTLCIFAGHFKEV